MNYCGLELCDVLNGEGFRVSLFSSGCRMIPKCKYCQNKKAWSFDYGKPFTDETKELILSELGKPYISGLSLLGGEVTDNLEDGQIIDLCRTVKQMYPQKTIWCWSGYLWEGLIRKPLCRKLFMYVDVLIDGRYEYRQRNLNRAWANSENQRVINVQESIKQDTVILYSK